MIYRLKILTIGLWYVLFTDALFGQGYFQQRVQYDMAFELDVKKHTFTGFQKLLYTNNSPDTLKKLYYHLYFNAFKPGSVMDVRSRSLPDADPRVTDRISKLKKGEQGDLSPTRLTFNGRPQQFDIVGTILEVTLDSFIAPAQTVSLNMEFTGQVPIQIRRSGRDSEEGIAYSMSQWYPKICAYDRRGWHPNPYVGREFYGEWGDFKVSITLDKSYKVVAGGVTLSTSEKEGLATHVFEANNVHDFFWAADPQYIISTARADNGTTMIFAYQPEEKTESWKDLPRIMARVFALAEQRFGKYPYPLYAFVQGGDGGMEYPMGTLITGRRPLNSLVGVSVHELMHAWFQGMLATNESLYAWMDEGFTTYATEILMNELRREKLLPGTVLDNPLLDDVKGYVNYALTGLEEPLSVHADHFESNTAYGRSSYTKGSVTPVQLAYIIGQPAMDKAFLDYYNKWAFKHPTADDFFKIVEDAGGMVLDWFENYWLHTTHTIDYGIESVGKDGRQTDIVLRRKGVLPMPLDIVVTYTDGTSELFYIPLDLQRGIKPNETALKRTVAPIWQWTDRTYTLSVPAKMKKIAYVAIDPSGRMADVGPEDNTWKSKTN